MFEAGRQAADRGKQGLWITAAMEVVEITAGWWVDPMAPQADGWYMRSHSLAIGLSAFADAATPKYAKTWTSRSALGKSRSFPWDRGGPWSWSQP